MTRKIPLTQGKFAIIDDCDFEYVSQFKWHANLFGNTKKHWYAVRRSGNTTLFMHRAILGAPCGMEVDHADNDGLNNTRSNIRICTKAENRRNVAINKKNTSGYKGVRLHKGRWEASIRANLKTRRKIYLGSFETPELAAVEYNKAAIKYHGDFAWLNEIPQGAK